MALYCSKELVNPWEKAGVAGHGSVVTDLSVPRSAQAIKNPAIVDGVMCEVSSGD